MRLIERAARWITNRTPRRETRHAMLGIEDLERLGLAPLQAMDRTMTPVVERRRRHEAGSQEQGVIMRRRASDWAPSGADIETVPDERTERHLA